MSHPIRKGSKVADEIGKHYMQVGNAAFRDRRITPKAKGVFGFMWSHEDGFGLTIEKIAEDMGVGVSAIRTALLELEQHGYLVRRRFRNEDGTWNADTIYELTDMPTGLSIIAAAPYDPEGVRRSEPGCGNHILDGDEKNTRSDPRCGFPTLENPHVDNRTPSKKNKLKNKPLPPSGVEAAPAHASTTDPDSMSMDSPNGVKDHAHNSTQPAANSRAAARRGYLPEGWAPSEQLLEWAAREVPGLDVSWESADFVAYWRVEAPRSKAKKVDWDRTWQNRLKERWVRLGYDRRPSAPASAPQVDLFDAVDQAAAESITEPWLAYWARQGTVVTPALRGKLSTLVGDALAAGATPERIKEALKLCKEPYPAPFRWDKAMAGVDPYASGSAVSRTEQEQKYRDLRYGRGLLDAQQRIADGTADDPRESIRRMMMGQAANAAQALRDAGEFPAPPGTVESSPHTPKEIAR
jgi:hypothetical protein